MKKQIASISAVLTLILISMMFGSAALADTLDWRLGFQSYTFHRNLSFEESLKTSAELGLPVIEAYPNHGLSKSIPHLKMHYKMNDETKVMVKELLAKYDVKLLTYGVVGLPNIETKCREVFDFAKEMGIETIVSEPLEDAFDLIDKLCAEYKINVAIHNHPKPSRYWDPDKVLEVCKGRSKYIGACADTGHWARSGIDPLEAIKKLEGRIISLHFKDLNESGTRKAHDVPWGTGKGQVKEILAELKRQNFAGVFSIEYEHNWGKALPEITECVEYFNKTKAELEGETPMATSEEPWILGIQLYSFNRFPLDEALERAYSVGVNWVEGYSWHQYSKDKPNIKLDPTMPAQFRAELKEKLKSYGIKLGSYYGGLPNNKSDCRKAFEFAKDMGIEIIVAEPEPAAFGLIDSLAQEYKIKVAVHNHPKETEDFPHKSLYWHPDNVLKVVEGRSEYIGVCADTGHWSRCGINAVEALRKLKGRIISVHLKDLNEFGNSKDAHDVPWGTGATGVKAILEELKSQNFSGPFLAEYEHNWLKSVPEIRQSAEFFNITANELGVSGWRMLFANDLSNAQFKKGSWEIIDGVLTRKGGGDIWTKAQYGNFILDLQFKVDKGSNSGVFIRTGSIEHFVQSALEVQIHDTTDGSPKGQCGAIFDCLSPKVDATKPAGQWNRYIITAKDNKINVIFNGREIIDMDLDLWDRPGRNPDGSRNKFGNPLKRFPRKGYIGLQDHGDPVWFRNIRIKPL